MRCRSEATALVLAGLLGAGPAPPPAAAQTFSDSTDVVVVQVPVSVLLDGRPVRGLGPGDFELLDGRKPQRLVGFETVDLTRPAAERPEPRQPPAAPLREAVPVSARRHFLLLFDLSFSQPDNLVAARQAARRLVSEQLHPSDLVAVATYAHSQGARLLLGFTSDRGQADLAISTLGLAPLYEAANDPLALLLGDFESLPRPRSGNRPGAAADRMLAEAIQQFSLRMGRQDRQREQERILALSGSLAGLARLLGAIEGRKHVVYLSEGFDSSALYGTQDTASIETMSRAGEEGRVWDIDSEARFGDTRSQSVVEQMLDEFRRAGAAIQAVDIGGLRSAADVAYGSSRATGAGAATRDSRRDGLAVMAASTGGRLIRSFNDLSDAMRRLLEQTGVTYLLSFQPEGLDLDGRYHRLRVRLKDPARGTEVLHRPGYYAPLPFAETPEDRRRLRTAGLVLGTEEGGMLDSSVLAVPIRTAGAAAYVPLLVEIDGAGLLAAADGSALPLELFVYAFDSGGTIHGFLDYRVTVDLAQARPRLERSGLKFFGHLDLPPGDYELRVLVRHRETGQHGLRGVRLRVPDPAAGPLLLPALFAEPFDRWLITRQEGLEARPYPFLQGDRPFLPAARPVLAAGQAEAILLAWGLGAGELEIDGRILAPGQPPRPIPLSIAGRTPGAGDAVALTIRLDTPRLPPGDYRLEVRLGEPEGGRTVASSAPFVVR